MGRMMQGIEICRSYWENVGLPSFKDNFSDRLNEIAIGMVGPGSECFFFDDEISRDHDWGPGFCIWMNNLNDHELRRNLESWYDSLPKNYLDINERISVDVDAQRVGVDGVREFYQRYTGLSHIPKDYHEWYGIPSSSLATCTNGQVFHDSSGTFTDWRTALLAFYPEEVRRHKIARLCLSASQSGQYNLLRSIKRKDVYTTRYCLMKFLADCISIVYLINKKYELFYKWAYRGVAYLKILGKEVSFLIERILDIPLFTPSSQKFEDYVFTELHKGIDEMGEAISRELMRQNMVDVVDAYLWISGEQIMKNAK